MKILFYDVKKRKENIFYKNVIYIIVYNFLFIKTKENVLHKTYFSLNLSQKVTFEYFSKLIFKLGYLC